MDFVEQELAVRGRHCIEEHWGLTFMVPELCKRAENLAYARQAWNVAHRARDKASGRHRQVRMDSRVTGMKGEFSACLAWLYPFPTRVAYNGLEPDLVVHDIEIEVRTTPSMDRIGLTIREEDLIPEKRARRYLSAVELGGGWFAFRGWCFGWQGESKGEWTDHGYTGSKKCLDVKSPELYDIRTLTNPAAHEEEP